jgi:hypothetical protein
MDMNASPRLVFSDDFDAPELDPNRWLAHYLPHWSTIDRTRPRYSIADGCLILRIDPDQPAWCPEFNGGVKVSNLQTGQFSGPVGSRIGQHRFSADLVVREEHPRQQLFMMHRGRIELRAKAAIGPANVAALWLIGFEDQPERSGELCLVEIKGWELDAKTALIGYGIKPWQDPSLRPDFHEDRLDLDVGEFHTYTLDWSASGVDFFVDGRLLRHLAQSPDYPMQLMLDLYELPGMATQERDSVASFTVDYVRVRELGPPAANGTSTGAIPAR